VATESDTLVAKLADDLKKSKQLSIVQHFARVDVLSENTARKRSPAIPILVSFQVEQNGRDLRIVDGDGSVYTGSVQVAQAASDAVPEAIGRPTVTRSFRAQQEAKPEAQMHALAAAQPAPQKYFFHVAGTNRSLNENVVFSGDLLTTNAVFLVALTNRAGTGGSLAKDQLLPETTGFPALPLRNSRISGKASVGDRGEFQINAVPAAR
jgi:hypothetical protein